MINLAGLSLDTISTAQGTDYRHPELGLIASRVYDHTAGEMSLYRFVPSPGNPEKMAGKLFGFTSVLNYQTCDWLALALACELAAMVNVTPEGFEAVNGANGFGTPIRASRTMMS